MAYRDAPIVLPTAPPDLTVPARILGIAALAFVALQLGTTFLVADATWMRWYETRSSMPQLLYWLGFACRFLIVPGAVLYAVRTDDRRARILAVAGAVLLTIGLASNVWATLHPIVRELDRTRPYWAPSKLLVPFREHVAILVYASGLACLAWALAKRDGRALATVVTAFAFGAVFHDVVNALEVPWMQLMTPDRAAGRIAGRLTFVVHLVATLGVGLSGVARRRPEPPRPPETPSDDPDEPKRTLRPDAAAYEALSPLVAGALAATIPVALLAMGNAAMMIGRGARDFDNWTSAAGIVRLEYFETSTYTPFGAFLCGSAFCVYAARRARHGSITAFMGVAWVGLAIVSVTIFMRGRWKVPISTSTDFGSFELVWALAGAAMLFLTLLLARRVGSAGRVLATEEKNDIHSRVLVLVNGVTPRITAAMVGAAGAILALAVGDNTRTSSSHEVFALGAGLMGFGAALAAILAARAHAKHRVAVAEAIRRRLDEPSRSLSEPRPA